MSENSNESNSSGSSQSSEQSISQSYETGRASQINPEANFDPGHLKDSGQDSSDSGRLREVDSSRFDQSHLKDSGQDSGSDGMSAGQGIEREVEEEMEMGM